MRDYYFRRHLYTVSLTCSDLYRYGHLTGCKLFSAFCTGKISNKKVNVEDAVQIREAQLQEFESDCPTGFYQTIKGKGITMKECKNNRGLIFARVTALMSTRAINLNDVLKYELAAVPTPIFDEKRDELRI